MNNLEDIFTYIEGLCSGIYGTDVYKDSIPVKKNNKNVTSGCAIRPLAASTEMTITGDTTNWEHVYSILTRDPVNKSKAEKIVELLNGTNSQIVGNTRILDIQAQQPAWGFMTDSTKLGHFNISLVVFYS